jgi:predicted transcriptional regulator
VAEVNYGIPTECGLRRGAVHKLAESVGSQLEYSPGDDLKEIIQSIGGKIKYQDFGELVSSSSGSIRIRGENDFTIFLPSYTSAERDRFTIAHELGHYILHYLYPLRQGNDPGPIQAQRYGTGRVEWEANWFAAAFLMPEDAFRKSYEEYDGDLFDIAEEFQVSIRAAQIRAKALKLLD